MNCDGVHCPSSSLSVYIHFPPLNILVMRRSLDDVYTSVRVALCTCGLIDEL